MQPVLHEQPNLLSLYHNYQEIVELILELLFECTKGTESILGHLTRVRLFFISCICYSDKLIIANTKFYCIYNYRYICSAGRIPSDVRNMFKRNTKL